MNNVKAVLVSTIVGALARASVAATGLATVVMVCDCRRSAGRPTTISVGGIYATHVTLLPATNTCGTATVQDNATVVTHTPGATTLSLTHAGHTYLGSVDERGGFTTRPTTLSDGGSQFTLTVDGQFSRTGLDATVHVAVRQQAAPTTCAYDAQWVGTKNGAPNTF